MRKLKGQVAPKVPYLMPDFMAKIVPPPVGGWNAIDPLSSMDPKYAPILDNWIPRTGNVEIRPGNQPWTQNPLSVATATESLMTYRPSGLPERLFAAIGATIYEVSSRALPTLATPLIFSNARWQHTMFTPSGGSNYLAMCNGQDPYQTFDGTNWVQQSITGVSSSTFVQVAVWKRRLWFVQINSTSAWFLGTDAISGAATQLDIGALLTKGGYLNAIGTITLDGGNGPQALIVFMSNRGEAVVYQGTDPTNANAFSLVGVFALPPPLGRRCFIDLGADLGVITLQGLIPFSQAMPVDSAAVRNIALTRTIQNAMLQSAEQFQDNFGWEVTHYPGQGLIVMNVPTETNVQAVQYVQNLLNGSWCRFTGWNANCFAIFNDLLYFGDDQGNVNLTFSGSTDNVAAINYDMQVAFNYFGDPGRLKHATMVKPLLVSSGQVVPTIGIDTDFSTNSLLASVTSVAVSGAEYDVSLYDVGVYSGGLVTLTSWQSAEALGVALAVHMKVNLLPAGAAAASVFGTMVFGTMMFGGAGSGTQTLQVNGFIVLLELGAYV
jgi:hypothetical protein